VSLTLLFLKAMESKQPRPQLRDLFFFHVKELGMAMKKDKMVGDAICIE
jgi:hypothetical protein